MSSDSDLALAAEFAAYIAANTLCEFRANRHGTLSFNEAENFIRNDDLPRCNPPGMLIDWNYSEDVPALASCIELARKEYMPRMDDI